MEFIYCGEVEIQNEGLIKFLEAANELQIDGLQQRGNGIEKLLHTSSEKGSDTVVGERPDWENENIFKELLLNPKSPTNIVKDEPFFESKDNVGDLTSKDPETERRISDEEDQEEEPLDRFVDMKEAEEENYKETDEDNEVVKDSTGGFD